jgi:hypothetical protein
MFDSEQTDLARVDQHSVCEPAAAPAPSTFAAESCAPYPVVTMNAEVMTDPKGRKNRVLASLSQKQFARLQGALVPATLKFDWLRVVKVRP